MEPLTWKFRYRSYKKQRVIQLKPHHDAENHFSIVWCKGKKLTVDEFAFIDNKIRMFIQNNDSSLTFTILRACTNCTYGRFQQSFEDMILALRDEYPQLCTNKDLTLGDPKHVELLNLVRWDEKHPIMHHIHARSNTGNSDIDSEWERIFRDPKTAEEISKGLLFGMQVKLIIEFE